MNTIATYNQACLRCSEIITRQYSTSFSWAIHLLHKDLRAPIHAIYGFVRLADEIVDTFHEHNKQALLEQFCADTDQALATGISMNPILQSFGDTVHKYRISQHLIDAFLQSMRMDLDKSSYADHQELDEYIYGSAEVVGLMCLHVFCEGNETQFLQLQPAARKLGAAFQKINFLRDLNDDSIELKRNYFPEIVCNTFNQEVKQQIEANIMADFEGAYEGILHLPPKARLGVYVAYRYYYSLLKKIKRKLPSCIMQERVRIPDHSKLAILLVAGIRSRFNLL
ncbi:phytoene/squalene synthase family protein [Chitinophaga arvensicola]|uniref:Phytoene/squalene synthetase n=1 Tax=Chitinophaga arvensicola TaxID=29529 RepID=A0A1I0R755_9BACT|nr:phytoene/squalene synthase family protein [Chitinophaga arvensicola]SEW36261.1 Phytoene/squalene synthetase [Chitinophaga arvensicola]